MNTLPKLSEVLKTPQEEPMTVPGSGKTQETDSKPVQEGLALVEQSKKENGGKPAFKPMKIIGKMDLFKNYNSTSGYAWNLVKKENNSTVNDSDMEGEGELNQTSPGLNHKEDLLQDTNACSPKDSRKSSARVLKQKDTFDDFQNKPWMQPSGERKAKQKSVQDKKLAVRSDVVNKTLLRSLKRYYTAKFEETTDYKKACKTESKEVLYDKLVAFTKKVYESDPRFKLEEFSEVTMDDLVFHMGICINPMHMKRLTHTPQQRTKFQSFYNCLYKYSHKKLMKLFNSSVLHFMFRKFFEEGPFDYLLENDDTLKRNPEIYRKASDHFLNLFRTNCTGKK